MDPAEQAKYRQRYNDRLAQFGYDPKSLGWMKGRQGVRFEALTRFVDLSCIKSVLDVGCGFGDLYSFLKDRGFAGKYVGVDFIERLIEVGKEVYPDADLRTCTLADFQEDESFDLVVSCGIFNAPHATPEKTMTHIEATMSQMFRLANVAAASDFISNYVDRRDDGVQYTQPEAVFGIAKKLTKRVTLAHDYLPFEFSVYMYRDDRIVGNGEFVPLTGEDRTNG